MRQIIVFWIVGSILYLGYVGAIGETASPDELVELAELVQVDTSRLMGSPDPLPPLEFQRAFPKLTIPRPVLPTHAGDGTNRMFVLTQDGKIFVFPHQRDAATTELFLDISDVVAHPGGDNGMFSLAFHPRYRDNGEFFVVYVTRQRPKSTVVSRFHVSDTDANLADRDSEEELLRIRQPYADHNAACLQFGPDGYLYIALGDGGYSIENGTAQDLRTLLGSMLRIDVDRRDAGKNYAIPTGNPFVGRADARDEIWAYGLRAPWRFSFDRVTGLCWLGDNGQVEFEEVNLIKPGANYGWMTREGFHAFDATRVTPRGRPVEGQTAVRQPDRDRNDGLVDPIVEYDHRQGKSVVGGMVYRGRRLPELIGAYLYGDYANGNIWALRWDGQKVTDNRLVARTRLKITSFGEDEIGELYFTAFDGHVYELRPARETTAQETFPTRLSETGLFESVKDLAPAAGMIPYSVNVPLWSDHAAKQRFVVLPLGKKVRFDENKSWQFPVGTVFVKTFLLQLERGRPESSKRLETRLLVHNPRGWVGYCYRWNDEQSDAYLLGDAATESYQVTAGDRSTNQTWYFPSRSDCIACHTRASGFVLGMNTQQMNRLHRYHGGSENQLQALDRIGFFTARLPMSAEQLPAYPDWEIERGLLDERARSYLDVNCSMCHTPPGYTKIDLRYQTPLAQTWLMNKDPEKPRLGPHDSKLVLPGHPEKSELWLRMTRRGPGQMPNLATSEVDQRACEVIAKWIRTLHVTPDAASK